MNTDAQAFCDRPCQDIRENTIRLEAFLTVTLNRHDISGVIFHGHIRQSSLSLDLALLSANLNGQANQTISIFPSRFPLQCNQSISILPLSVSGL